MLMNSIYPDRNGFAILVGILVTALLMGLPNFGRWKDALIDYSGTWNSMTTIDPATEAALSIRGPQTFAVIGQGGVLPRSSGLEEWTLQCRHLAQRPWESELILSETMECLSGSNVILVSVDRDTMRAPQPYVDFVQATNDLLRAEYLCSTINPYDVCVRQ